jgi:hypothetical protein
MLLIAGCGQQAHGAALDASVSGSSSASVPTSPEPTPTASGTCASARLTVTNADNGNTLCVRPGTALLVLLRNGTGPIRYSGPLAPRADGRLMLMRGVTGAAFTAVRPGVATITSVISPCASEPGPVHCLVLMLFRLRVEIRAS